MYPDHECFEHVNELLDSIRLYIYESYDRFPVHDFLPITVLGSDGKVIDMTKYINRKDRVSIKKIFKIMNTKKINLHDNCVKKIRKIIANFDRNKSSNIIIIANDSIIEKYNTPIFIKIHSVIVSCGVEI